MKMLLLLFFVLSITSNLSVAQNSDTTRSQQYIKAKQALQNSHTISGKVFDARTKEPLPMVNVYLSGTLFGTSTDNHGKYVLNNAPDGKYNLVISIIGYQSRITSIVLKNSNSVELNFSLNEKVYETKPVEVSGEVPEEWRDQLEFFKEKFLGTNDFAEDCVIENENRLEFHEDSELFSASINEPLVVYNYDLGYVLKCVIIKFTYDKGSGITYSNIYPSISEMHTLSKDSLDTFYANRRKAYLGSSMHFLNTIINGKTDPFFVSFFSLDKAGNVKYTEDVYTISQILDFDKVTGIYYFNPYKTHLRNYFYKCDFIH